MNDKDLKEFLKVFKRIADTLEALNKIVEEKENLVQIVQGEPPEPELPEEFVLEPPKPKCQKCGHEKSFHEPLDQKGCFPHGGCNCRGWK